MLRMGEAMQIYEKAIGRRGPSPCSRLKQNRTTTRLMETSQQDRVVSGHLTALVADGMVLTEVQVGS